MSARRRPVFSVACLLVGFALALTGTAPAASSAAPPGPGPAGDPWPDGLRGPFEVERVLHVRVASHDGTPLDGWIVLPKLPRGVRAPVALSLSPYLGYCQADPRRRPGCRITPDDPAWLSEDPPPDAEERWDLPPIDLVRHGYAAAFFSQRGTGNSGGCYDGYGLKTQRDGAALVRFLARQPWANGRVAMGGLSAEGTTPLAAAIHRPAALKAIVVGGIISDPYTALHTPQGAPLFLSGIVEDVHHPTSNTSLTPPLGGGVGHGVIDHVAPTSQRLCSEFVRALMVPRTGAFTDVRDARYWNERRMIDRYDDITAAVLLVQGFHDNSQHGFQESAVWSRLRSPKRQIEGQWGHTFPIRGVARLNRRWAQNEWSEIVFGWLDYWLKGVGTAPRLGRVDYQDSAGRWRVSSSWPPKDARREVLYLTRDALRASPGGPARSFRSAPNILNSYRGARAIGFPIVPWSALCRDPATQTTGTAGLAYISQPATRAVTIAGNPFAYLRLESDQPGGIVGVSLVDVGPGFSCDSGDQPRDVEVVTWGAADLRFHAGNLRGRDFPVGTARSVRVDLMDQAHVLRPRHRLALVVSFGETHIEWLSQPYHPEITVVSTGPRPSQVVLPVVDGSLGGAAPRIQYPPRPFVPRGR